MRASRGRLAKIITRSFARSCNGTISRWWNLRNTMRIRPFLSVTKVTSPRKAGCITIALWMISFMGARHEADRSNDVWQIVVLKVNHREFARANLSALRSCFLTARWKIMRPCVRPGRSNLAEVTMQTEWIITTGAGRLPQTHYWKTPNKL
jgi:hypothetical protein